MSQITANVRSQTFTPADTAVHVFPDTPARGVVFQTPSGNAGTVTVFGVNGSTADATGIVIATGKDYPLYFEVKNLNQLAYKMSNAADTLVVMYTQ